MLARGNFGFPLASHDRHWSSDDPDHGKDDDKLSDEARDPDSASGAKPKRKRPKFIRKVDCQVGSDTCIVRVSYEVALVTAPHPPKKWK
jgi:hypothetical protein